MLMTSLDASILYTTMPRLSEVFHAESSTVGWLNIVYYIVNLSLTLTIAKVGDALGRKRILLFGLALYSCGLALAAMSFNMVQLICARAMQGVGGATAASLGTAITVAVFPPDQRGKAVGILAGAGSAGLVVGPIVGGLLLDLLDWRAVFYARVPIIIACLAAIWSVVREQRQEKRKAFSFDLSGSGALFVWLSSFLIYLSMAGRWGFSGIRNMPFAAGAVLFLVLFLIVERRSSEPVVELGLFRKRLFATATVSATVIAIGTSATAFLVPFYLLKGLGMSASAVGGYMAVLAVPALIFSPICGRLSDRIGSRGLSTFGVLVVCLSLFLLSRLGTEPTPFAIGLAVALTGAGIGIFHPPNSSALIGAVPKDMLGVASAIAMMARMVGTSIALALGGAAFDISESRHLLGLLKEGTDPAIAKKIAAIGGFHDALMVLLPIAAIGVLTSLVRGPKE
jgi:EmrB/QacA subfamily drug resistance transporter